MAKKQKAKIPEPLSSAFLDSYLEGLKRFGEDPEASVFNRIIVDANEQGRVA